MANTDVHPYAYHGHNCQFVIFSSRGGGRGKGRVVRSKNMIDWYKDVSVKLITIYNKYMPMKLILIIPAFNIFIFEITM